jgi:hypothetical protein
MACWWVGMKRRLNATSSFRPIGSYCHTDHPQLLFKRLAWRQREREILILFSYKLRTSWKRFYHSSFWSFLLFFLKIDAVEGWNRTRIFVEWLPHSLTREVNNSKLSWKIWFIGQRHSRRRRKKGRKWCAKIASAFRSHRCQMRGIEVDDKIKKNFRGEKKKKKGGATRVLFIKTQTGGWWSSWVDITYLHLLGRPRLFYFACVSVCVSFHFTIFTDNIPSVDDGWQHFFFLYLNNISVMKWRISQHSNLSRRGDFSSFRKTKKKWNRITLSFVLIFSYLLILIAGPVLRDLGLRTRWKKNKRSNKREHPCTIKATWVAVCGLFHQVLSRPQMSSSLCIPDLFLLLTFFVFQRVKDHDKIVTTAERKRIRGRPSVWNHIPVVVLSYPEWPRM